MYNRFNKQVDAFFLCGVSLVEITHSVVFRGYIFQYDCFTFYKLNGKFITQGVVGFIKITKNHVFCRIVNIKFTSHRQPEFVKIKPNGFGIFRCNSQAPDLFSVGQYSPCACIVNTSINRNRNAIPEHHTHFLIAGIFSENIL
ncbi:MAG: hypothetical protein BWY70_01641 [Bacteroidetes bacterium ADurb.Bin408]|nr:MAG: hypothetical protein BWY70_01641 [Bacteroidetes bacterium ADurb.Bin408]